MKTPDPGEAATAPSTQAHPDATGSGLLFSVIIPLEYHRGQWQRCWRAWRDQTAARSSYEIILVVPPDFQRDALPDELSATRVEFSARSHDISLCADGATRARGKYLIFTESHCWPEPDVIERCIEVICDNPGWAGFSGLSIPVTPNRLSRAEADMYMADIAAAMQDHPWRQILDHCFVTSRAAYEDCGGFQSGLGHFAEWALAASYFQRGHRLAHAARVRCYHYYRGSLRDVKNFTRDFVAGELRYFSERFDRTGVGTLAIPPEWICRGNHDRRIARAVLHMTMQSLWPLRNSLHHLAVSVSRIARWIVPALFGDGAVRLGALVSVASARTVLLTATAMGSPKWLSSTYKNYVAALITAQRLAVIAGYRRTKRDARASSGPPARHALAMATTGFYPLEQSGGHEFRWSEPAAMALVPAVAGAQRIRIDCIPVRDLTDGTADLRFYVDGARVPPGRIALSADYIIIDLDVTEACTFELGWSCMPMVAAGDRRQLGLAIRCIELVRRGAGDDSAIPTAA